MTKSLDISQGYISLVAEYSEPFLTLFAEPRTLYDQVLKRLGPSYGLRLADMKVEWGERTLADHNLNCYFLNYGASLRFRLERLEMWFDIAKVAQADALGIAREAFEAITVLQPPSFRSFHTDIAVHGELADAATKDFLASFTKEAPNAGPLIGTGCVFYYGPEDVRLSSSGTVDISAVVKDGLFFRYNVIWDGSKIKPLDLLAVVPGHFEHLMGLFGLSRKVEG